LAVFGSPLHSTKSAQAAFATEPTFARYGSAGFAADLEVWGEQVVRLMSLSYRETLAVLASSIRFG